MFHWSLRIARADDLVHQHQRAGDDGAARLRARGRILLVDLGRLRVVADEDDLDLVVVARQEQVQQDEEALGEVLARLVHRARHVHHAEHHRLRAGVGLLDQQVVFEIERIEERHAMDARAEFFDFCFEFLNITEVVRLFAL